MLNPHESLGIAQIIFYVPIVPAAIKLMHRNGQILRLAGGPVTIALEQSPSIGLYSAAIVLLNVGVVPLIIATLGFVRIILLDNYTTPSRAKTITALMRATIIIAIGLLAAGGGISSLGTPSATHLSRTLTLVGYIVFAVMHAALVAIMSFFYRRRKDTLVPSSRTIIRAGLLASPFLLTRTIFGLLQVARQNDSSSSPFFNPVVGNAAAFGLMALLPEYVVVLAYMYAGFSIAPDRGVAVRGVVVGGEETVTRVTQEAAKSSV
ncbi:hypothetical protein BBK36DRAFT_1121231 [Trichoderma citrinoviride]|uniref:DUF7702 domain-containing protein n=1 Tax=Trichoderma citrinoviride TaxID=58853 RepID=A0A2T4B8L1_9HYPO|nr:hypothetical protein BBK36DRAFT_1121231 [Trichoderma citrinoviride]PTB65666.1 hypothetical protein BBK36DRAFT_1121231 [Trichoderma citrinoviride]